MIAYSLVFCYDKRTVRKAVCAGIEQPGSLSALGAKERVLAVKRGTFKKKAEEKEGWV